MRFTSMLMSLLVSSFALAAAPAPTPNRRILTITAPSLTDDTYRTQAALLIPAWRGLLEREFVVETRFGAPAFSVVLIGKDGGEKLRRTTPLPPEELFAVVDAMPMRRAEMRSSK